MKTEKEHFFRVFNESFVKGDVEKILASVTDDITWRMIGNDTLNGMDQLENALQGMENGNQFEQELENFITDENGAVMNGIIHSTDKSGEQRHYSFCDIYKLDKHKGEKIKEIISYVVEL